MKGGSLSDALTLFWRRPKSTTTDNFSSCVLLLNCITRRSGTYSQLVLKQSSNSENPQNKDFLLRMSRKWQSLREKIWLNI